MIKHNLLLIYRNFKRFKSSFLINLFGLSMGLACSLLIYLWVVDELSVDKFHAHDERLYIMLEHRLTSDGIWTAVSSPGPMAETVAAEFPEVEYAAGSSWWQNGTLSVGETSLRTPGRYASKDFFRMFSYPLIGASPATVLSDRKSIVISKSLAARLFGSAENVIGKSVRYDHNEDFQVSGIFEDVPANASEQFEFVLSYEKWRDENEWTKYWGNTGCMTLVLLKPGVDVNEFNKKIADLVKVKSEGNITHRTPFLKQYSSQYLYGSFEDGVQKGGRIDYVQMFSVIAVFILVIACINFMNLSTAKASRRIKEVGIKKAVGAGRWTLAVQYLSESLLMTLLSVLLALLIVDLLLPHFNLITGKVLELQFTPEVIIALVAITIFTGVLAGSYPALYLSAFSPTAVLKGKLNKAVGEVWARKGLVVFQFTLSIILIVSVIVVYRQISFLQNKNLGYDKDNVIMFQREGKAREGDGLETFLDELRNIPGVVNASSLSHNMTGHNSGTYSVQWPGRDPEDKTEFENLTVNYGTIELLGIEMAEGRTFSKDFASDSSAIILNEAAIDYMGFPNPLGKVINLWGKDMTIVGVTRDFHFESLHKEVKPLFFRLAPSDTYLIAARIAAGQEKATLDRLDQFYTKFNPGFPLDYIFLDQRYANQYQAEQRVATLSKYFAGLAIIISCLGLFGLAAFTAERRLKEIGIRKVLGSTNAGIVYLLSGDFTKMVLAAIMLALPLSYYLAVWWLEDFEFKISLHWWNFIAAGLVAMIIAWITVGLQTVRAARTNPAQCLKDE